MSTEETSSDKLRLILRFVIIFFIGLLCGKALDDTNTLNKCEYECNRFLIDNGCVPDGMYHDEDYVINLTKISEDTGYEIKKW